MRTRAIVFVLAFASYPCAHNLPRTMIPLVVKCRTTRSLMLLNVTVGGKSKRLILDTRAERTMILSTAGDFERRATLIIGSKTVSNLPLIMANLSWLGVEKVGADYVLGQDVFRKFSVVRIDHKVGTVELEA